MNLVAALPLWFLGIVLGLAYEHTGSLLLPIGIHACFNLATALSLLVDKGILHEKRPGIAGSRRWARTASFACSPGIGKPIRPAC